MEKTQSAKAPDVDVDVEPGRWPKYDVNWADVDVGSKTKTIMMPTVEVTRRPVQVEVPYIEINQPGAKDVEDRTVTVDLDVPSTAYGVQIQEVRASGDTLWVIAELTRTGKADADRQMRISDQVIVRAPEDLHVRRIVIGERPDGVYNQQYTFVSNREAMEQRLPKGGGRVIFQRRGQPVAGR